MSVIHYEKTTEFLDPTSMPEEVGDTPTHLRYNCPVCIIKRGKEDDDGKLYWDKEKHIGWCFKCSTTFLLMPLDEQDLNTHAEIFNPTNEIKELSEHLVNSWSYKESASVETSVSINDFNPLGDVEKTYLASRHHLLLPLMNLLGLKALRSTTRNGVITPFYDGNKLVSYQCRFITEDKRFRFYTMKADKKPIYCPNLTTNMAQVGRSDEDYEHMLFMRDKQVELTFSEGTYDTIANMLMGLPNPCASLGSSFTDHQLQILRKINPSKIILAMDDRDINSRVEKDLLSKNVDIVITEFSELYRSKSKDPENLLKAVLASGNSKMVGQVLENMRKSIAIITRRKYLLGIQ